MNIAHVRSYNHALFIFLHIWNIFYSIRNLRPHCLVWGNKKHVLLHVQFLLSYSKPPLTLRKCRPHLLHFRTDHIINVGSTAIPDITKKKSEIPKRNWHQNWELESNTQPTQFSLNRFAETQQQQQQQQQHLKDVINSNFNYCYPVPNVN
jgi:hypothetical protein